jgi:hypothetical protein
MEQSTGMSYKSGGQWEKELTSHLEEEEAKERNLIIIIVF